ncbi:MAG: TetR/AcrR family transcriptional regulator [Ramlibacter sp.]|nr:TetR/AcrR family transcriptional regulator [Ramlibacter sp.]
MILRKAFELIYIKGFQATSIDDIIATTQVTKGAFYYHFKQKDEMGLAIINEILKPSLIQRFIEPLQGEGDPLEQIYAQMHYMLIEDKFLKPEYGCPVANLTQEMMPWNKLFGKALNELAKKWEKELIAKIDYGKKNGIIRNDINAKQAVIFIISGYWGIRTLGKLANNQGPYRTYLKELKKYLDSMR